MGRRDTDKSLAPRGTILACLEKVTRSLAPVACCLAAACASGSALRQRADSVAGEVKMARDLNAEVCAPRELATAETNLRLARAAIDQGDARRADAHLDSAAPAARDAVARSKECGGKQAVVIKDKPEPQAPLAVAPNVTAKDSDGDGVPDVDDLCPDVPGPAERRGCPVFADADGDGVSDDIDRCPEQPGPKENFGCPWPDRDGDRVADKDDRCPDEPGSPDNQGCPRKGTLIVVRRDRIELKQQIHFQPNRAKILRDSYEVLGEVADAIRDSPATVRIEGHTDNVGNRKENVALSQARADAVKEYLIHEGVEAKQLSAVGYGPKRPIASNSTRAGRTLNRRVEFRIEETN
jgi:outer membrane protein OmpA-like peptidoglycan-associated protein